MRVKYINIVFFGCAALCIFTVCGACLAAQKTELKSYRRPICSSVSGPSSKYCKTDHKQQPVKHP